MGSTPPIPGAPLIPGADTWQPGVWYQMQQGGWGVSDNQDPQQVRNPGSYIIYDDGVWTYLVIGGPGPDAGSPDAGSPGTTDAGSSSASSNYYSSETTVSDGGAVTTTEHFPPDTPLSEMPFPQGASLEQQDDGSYILTYPGPPSVEGMGTLGEGVDVSQDAEGNQTPGQGADAGPGQGATAGAPDAGVGSPGQGSSSPPPDGGVGNADQSGSPPPPDGGNGGD
jgi:hypothetical protein